MRVGINFDYNSKGVKLAKAGLASLAKGAIGASLSIGGTALALQRLTAQAAKDQRAFTVLGNTLANAGFGGAEKQAKALFDQMELQYGVITSDLLPAYTSLFNSVGSVRESQRILNTAVETSIATGKDLGSVSAALAKAYLGQNTAIGKLNIGFTKAELSAMSFDEVLAEMQRKFKGGAAASADTFATRMDRIRLAVNQARTAIGEGLIDAIDMLATDGGSDIDKITAKIVNMGVKTGDAIRGLTDLVTTWKRVSQNGPLSGLLAPQDNVPSLPSPIDLLILKPLKALTERGKELRTLEQKIGRGGSYFTLQAQRKAEAAAARERRLEELRRAKEERLKRLAAAKAAADKRAQIARDKKEAELQKKANELAKQFDTERIGLAAALGREQDANTRARLQSLMLLNEMQYTEQDNLSEIEKLLAKIKELQDKLTNSAAATGVEVAKIYQQYKLTADEAQRLAGIYATSMAASKAPSAAAFRAADQLASAGLNLSGTAITPGSGAAPSGTATGTQAPVVNNTFNINALSTMDVEEAIATAVNTGSRAGLAYTQVFSRL